MRKRENQKHTGRISRDEIHTSAPPQTAWEAWADPEKIAQWFVDRAEGKAEPGATIKWFFDSFHLELPYKVLEAVPGERYSIRWEGPEPPPGILEVIVEREGNQTLVRLIQSGFREEAQWDQQYEGVSSGWHMALGLLRHYLENYFGEPRRSILVMRPAHFTSEQIDPYYREPARLTNWLTEEAGTNLESSGGIGNEGDRCELVLRGGGKLTGIVLARTAHEVAVSWPGRRAALELKLFVMGPQRMLAIRVSAWKCPDERAEQIQAMAAAALDRLVESFPLAKPTGV